MDPALAAYPNLSLLTNAYVTRLNTDASGHSITGVEVQRDDKTEIFSADIVVVACGALSSALLLLRSGNDKHPNGLANGSGQVGRNYMRHNQSVLMALRCARRTIPSFKKPLPSATIILARMTTPTRSA